MRGPGLNRHISLGDLREKIVESPPDGSGLASHQGIQTLLRKVFWLVGFSTDSGIWGIQGAPSWKLRLSPKIA
ncbi:hypothetical protein U1Q18_025979 [Sarracenia purpurea var. burkii]